MFSLFKNKSENDITLYTTIKGILGKKPKNLDLYKLAVRHASMPNEESNERLEYLGDAILGAIIAEYLFKKFPYRDEGFLTEIRSRIVKRESLNALALRLGLNKILEFQNQGFNGHVNQSIYGNALEAFIGAIYLDRGHRFCKNFVIDVLVKRHINIKEVIEKHHNYKSVLIEWVQKNGKTFEFNVNLNQKNKNSKEFSCEILINGKILGSGIGYSKKKAEQAAAQKACTFLKIID